jgi:hypothetical protein
MTLALQLPFLRNLAQHRPYLLPSVAIRIMAAPNVNGVMTTVARGVASSTVSGRGVCWRLSENCGASICSWSSTTNSGSCEQMKERLKREEEPVFRQNRCHHETVRSEEEKEDTIQVPLLHARRPALCTRQCSTKGEGYDVDRVGMVP